MVAMIGIYAERVKAHIHSGGWDAAQMPKKKALPTNDARRSLTDSDATVIANIGRLMSQHGIIGNNQSELARKAVIDQTFISKLLKSKTSISVSYLHKIALALGVEPWTLLVPGEWKLSNPPALRPLTDTEKRLYEKIEEARVIAMEIARGSP